VPFARAVTLACPALTVAVGLLSVADAPFAAGVTT